MDALMAALVAGALLQVGDRTAWLTAILSDRHRPAVTIVAAALALALASGIAAAAGALVAPLLTPNAKALFLALALVMAGGGCLIAARPPERLERWGIGGFATAFLGLFILAFGDALQFVVVALAARGSPPLAAIGATLGSLAVIVPAACLGERDWTRLPLVRARRGIGALAVLVGLIVGLGGFGLL